LQARIALAGKIWYDPQGEPIRFPAPTLYPSPQNQMLDTDMEGFGIAKICMGNALSDRGELFATRPFEFVRAQGLTKPSDYDSIPWFQNQLTGHAWDNAGINSIQYQGLPAVKGMDVTLGVNVHNGFSKSRRGIFDCKRNMIWPPSLEMKSDTSQEHQAVATLGWFRFRNLATSLFTIVDFSSFDPVDLEGESGNGEFGEYFVMLNLAGGRATLISSQYAGD